MEGCRVHTRRVPIGRNRIRRQTEQPSDIDVTEWAGGHNEYMRHGGHLLMK
jgi:hypothetical protein